jgi:hypothetical protein
MNNSTDKKSFFEQNTDQDTHLKFPDGSSMGQYWNDCKCVKESYDRLKCVKAP